MNLWSDNVRWFWWLIVLVVIAAALEIFGAVAEGADSPHSAVCRVTVHDAEGRCYGSGTLIHKQNGVGVVITCWHLFRGGRGDTVLVSFPGDRSYQAQVIALDQAFDLAALRIASPAADPVAIAADHPRPGEPLQYCGYGQTGQYGCGRGAAIGYARRATTSTYETLELSGAARDGDSGGPIFNARGELVAVLWGTDGRLVAGSFCGRIRKFLGGVGCGPFGCPRRQPVNPYGTVPATPQPPVPTTPLVPVQPVEPQPPGGSQPACPPIGPLLERLDGLAADVAAFKGQADRLQAIEQRLSGEQLGRVVRDQLGPLLQPIRDQLGEGATAAIVREALPKSSGSPATGGAGWLSAVLPVLTALGWTTPPTAGALAAAWFLARMIRRRRRLRRTPPTDQAEGGSASADGTFPVGALPRVATEAAEILRLSQTEGRDPVLDALVGRVTFDTLDNLVDAGGPQADWAGDLRRQLKDRVDRIMPVAVSAARPNR